MMKVLAPRLPRGCRWLSLVLVLAGIGPAALFGQSSASKKDAPAKSSSKPEASADDDAPAKEAKDGGEKGGEPKGAEEKQAENDKTPSVEFFKDPRAADALKADSRPVGKQGRVDSEVKAVKSMASGASNIDRDAVRKFVEAMTYELTSPNNIKAIVDTSVTPNPNSSAAKAINRATNDLLDPIFIARANNNSAFLNTYSTVLLEKLPPLLKMHLISRIEAMIVLGQLGTPQAIDLYVRQINDAKQTVWVKMWAARGIDNATNHGARDLDAFQAVPAAKALTDLLGEKDVPWPVQMRALEALGGLRMASDPKAASKAEMASTAMRLLADPEARPEVRATAAWALGMMRGTSAIPKFNYNLVAYHVGEVAADLGGRVSETYSENKTRSEYWTGLLLSRVFHALYGENAARDSGLVQESRKRSEVVKVADLVRPVVETSIQMLRSPGNTAKQRHQELGNQVTSLKAYLEKNPPTDARLVPGGPEFPVNGANAVADVPEAKARVAADRGAR